jgi:D-arabinose 1-dehydrogenase-like Zn-dependent alcohol dehydrogenase
MLQRGGRYLVMGCIVPRDTFTADPSLWVGGNITIHGVSLYPTQALINAIDFVEAHAERLPLDAMVAETYSLDDFELALEAADALGKSPNAARVALQIA